jgi:ribosomal-protein-alanine N-acetyltransferase
MRRPFLQGERVYLRALETSDLTERYLQWFNDAEVCAQNGHHRFPNSEARMEAYLREVVSGPTDLVLAIIDASTDEHIGNIALQGIDPVARSAEYAIIVGEQSRWGGGYAAEASRLLLRHGFEELNLHRVHLGTPEGNVAMQRLAAALGMREEGRRREAFYKGGAYHDVLEYGILRSEFQAEGR